MICSSAVPSGTAGTSSLQVIWLQWFARYLFPKGVECAICKTRESHNYALFGGRGRQECLPYVCAGITGRRRIASLCFGVANGRVRVVKDRAIRRWPKRIASGWRASLGSSPSFAVTEKDGSMRAQADKPTGPQLWHSVLNFTSYVNGKKWASGRKGAACTLLRC